jgi:hypothetical protein
MTIIFIENEVGSGQIVSVAEAFRKLTVERNLRPGESGRFLMSPFKSIVVNERMTISNRCDEAKLLAYLLDQSPGDSATLARRLNND